MITLKELTDASQHRLDLGTEANDLDFVALVADTTLHLVAWSVRVM